MLVVADSSPLIVLINTGYTDILPKSFGKVVIPPEVWAELEKSAGTLFFATKRV